MPLYSRILIAVDDTDISKLAMEEAIKLAKDQKATLIIIYIADEFIPAGEGVPIDFKEHENLLRKKGRTILNKMIAPVRRTKISYESHLIEITESSDKIAVKIIEEAKKRNADLIVMGTHGRAGLSRLILGSVAEEVVRNAPVPVQLVKTQDKTEEKT